MTLASDLLTVVRSNINEPSTITDPQRSDTELLAWLDQAMFDYLQKVPREHFPELIQRTTFTGTYIAVPSDYLFFHSMVINHTLSGTLTGVDECWVLDPGETYFVNNYPGYMGAYCQFVGANINAGPNCFAGTLSYVKRPTHITTGSITFGLNHEHETPIVNYATALALAKVNDADAENYLALYTDSVAAKIGRQESKSVKRA